MAVCPRCNRETLCVMMKCKNCGTVYCDYCSGEGPGEVGTKTSSCYTTTCPVCKQYTGEEIKR